MFIAVIVAAYVYHLFANIKQSDLNDDGVFRFPFSVILDYSLSSFHAKKVLNKFHLISSFTMCNTLKFDANLEIWIKNFLIWTHA